MPSIRFSRTSSAIFSIIVALFTWYGISVTMIASRSLRIVSTCDPAAHQDRAAAGRVGRADAGAAEDRCRRSGNPGPGRSPSAARS